MNNLQRIDHDSENGRWTLLRAAPPIWLQPYIREIQGYSEEAGQPVMRKELPSGIIPMILVFGHGFSLHDRSTHHISRSLDRSFIAGLHERYVLVGSAGQALCMQVDFTPLGARRFLRLDLLALTGEVVDLDSVIGSFATRLEDRLSEASGWPERFDILERALTARIMTPADEKPLIREALSAIERWQGDIRIGELAKDLNCSRKHLSMLFLREIGLVERI